MALAASQLWLGGADLQERKVFLCLRVNPFLLPVNGHVTQFEPMRCKERLFGEFRKKDSFSETMLP